MPRLLAKLPAIITGAFASFLLGFAAPASAATGSGNPCAFVTASSSPAAFCDTFSRPMGTAGSRSGQLNSVVWGVSRASSRTDPSKGLLYNWAAVRRNTCGRVETVQPEHDVAVCDGQAVEAVNDNGGVAELAMYPRQPFDFAGRTGTVAFDVSDNTRGPNAAWPAFLITDQPVPAPYSEALGLADHAHASVGFTLAAVCGALGCGGLNDPPGVGTPGFSCVGVDSVFMTVDYALQTVPFHADGCVLPSKAVGSDNHFEVQVSSRGIKIFGSDPGMPQMTRLIADASFHVPLTRGLIWLEDVHSDGNQFNAQQSNTFSWANVAFDGPVLPRDLGFDVLDNHRRGPRAQNGLPTVNLGYMIPGRHPLVLTIPHVRQLARAHASLLELTYWAQRPQTIYYAFGRHARHAFRWPFGGEQTYVSETAAMPVTLSELRNGNNTLRLWTSDRHGVAIANLDLILAGAGGIPARP
jgi:hypothetical protein